MSDVEPSVALAQAKKLMVEALQLLDGVQAWEPSAHLDLAIQRLDVMLGENNTSRGDH